MADGSDATAPDGAGPDVPVAERVGRLLGRPVRSMQLLGRGVDHVAYEIDGAYVARVALEVDDATGPAMAREAALLEVVAAASPIPVPTVVAHDARAGLSIAAKLAGTSLLDRPCPRPTRLAGQLARFLAALGTIDGGRLRGLVEPDPDPPASFLAEAVELYPRLAGAVPRGHRDLVERFLAADPPAPATQLVLCHNDLGAEHLLAAGEVLTGVIDWSDAALADPAVDLGRLYRDLGPATVAAIADRLGLDAGQVLPRAAFYARCALLEDLDHGLGAGDRRYAEAALANLARTFQDPFTDAAPG